MVACWAFLGLPPKSRSRPIPTPSQNRCSFLPLAYSALVPKSRTGRSRLAPFPVEIRLAAISHEARRVSKGREKK